MTIKDFKEKLDSRGPFTFDEMWPTAKDWQNLVNEDPANEGIEWSWDCNLKLDYDGSLLRLSSRFYPPHKSHVDFGKYHGTVRLFFGEYEINESNTLVNKEFEAQTIDQLKEDVEVFVRSVVDTSRNVLFENKDRFSRL